MASAPTTLIAPVTAPFYFAIGPAPTEPPASIAMVFDSTGTNGAGTGAIVATAAAGQGMPTLELICIPSGEDAFVFFACGPSPTTGNPYTKINGDFDVSGAMATTANSYQGAGAPPVNGLLMTWNISGSLGESDFVNAGGTTGAFRWYNGPGGAEYDENSIPLMELVSNGSLLVFGPIGTRDNSSAGAGAPVNGCLIAWNLSDGLGETDFVNAGTVTGAFRWFSGAGSAAYDSNSIPIMELDDAGNLTIEGDFTTEGNLTVENLAVSGDVVIEGNLSAETADFNACSVAGSPVLTQANLPPPGIPYPPAGIGVSTGSAWETSINPANVPLLNIANDFTQSIAINGSAVRTMANTPNAVPQSYPGSGIGVSTGSAWGTSINPANVAMLNAPNANFNGAVSAAGTGPLASATNVEYLSGTGGRLLVASPSGSAAEDFIFVSMSGDGSSYHEFLRYLAASNSVKVETPLQVVGTLTSAAFTAVDSDTVVTAANPLIRRNATGDFILSAVGGSGVYINYDQGTGGFHVCNGAGSIVSTIDNAGNVTFEGGIQCVGYPGVTIGTKGFHMFDDGSTCFINGGDGGRLWLNYLSGTDEGQLVTITGALQVNGAKSFVCAHPLIEGKDLIHSCLEGPENGVFYRGEAVTRHGRAEVMLPTYFEALTFDDERSVLLTQITESDDEPMALLAATRIIDGIFWIRSSEDVRVAWEVKAVRRIGVDRLQIVRERTNGKRQTGAN